MSVQTRHLRAVESSTEQRGAGVIDKLHELNSRRRAQAKRELLSELIDHYMGEPLKPLTSGDVAEHLISVAGEIEG